VIKATTFGRTRLNEPRSRTGRCRVVAWIDKYSQSHVVVSTLLVFRRVMKDSRLSQATWPCPVLLFTIAICGTLGLDLILDDSTHERHPRAPRTRTRIMITIAAKKSLNGDSNVDARIENTIDRGAPFEMTFRLRHRPPTRVRPVDSLQIGRERKGGRLVTQAYRHVDKTKAGV
jgi:hypothetical protein